MLDLEMYLFYIFNLSWSSIAATKWNTAVTKIHLFYLFFYFLFRTHKQLQCLTIRYR